MRPEKRRWMEFCKRDPNTLTDEEIDTLNAYCLADDLAALIEEFVLEEDIAELEGRSPSDQ
jgi:hypothetical protein